MLTRLRGLLQRHRVERELDDEVQFHIEMETQSNVRRGMSPSEARRRALCDLGGVIQTKEAVRYVRTMSFESLWHDVRGAVRSLRRQPGFTATVTVTLALGVGANAALFGLVDALIIRPPAHVREPQRLVEVNAPTYVRYRQLSESVHTLDLTAYTRNALSLGLGPEAIQIRTECATPTYFPLVGARPLIGRGFTNDDEGAGREPTAVIAYGLWRRQFGGDTTVLGRRITIAGRPFTVIGVAPAGFAASSTIPSTPGFSSPHTPRPVRSSA
ncbi:MAG: ABC transporter permease [Vicinamibacterales bacterium]